MGFVIYYHYSLNVLYYFRQSFIEVCRLGGKFERLYANHILISHIKAIILGLFHAYIRAMHFLIILKAFMLATLKIYCKYAQR